MSTFYVASKLENAKNAEHVADFLRDQGHSCTYSWWTHGSVQAEGTKRITEVALAEIKVVEAADFVIVLLPGNLSPTSIGLLQAKLDGLAADLNARCLEDSRASLSGLAGLAAVLAN